MRVISGTAGGLPLKSPKRHPLRPTQDRIRQVIFSSLAARVPEARVLDLYAGTGSCGIEALSRGAKAATFVEQDAEAAQCIRDNLQFCRLTGDVRPMTVETFLAGAPPEKFDLIFADPPYVKESGTLDEDLPLAQIAPLLHPDGVFIWEHYAQRKPQALAGWEVIREKAYGETGLLFLILSRKK